MSFALLALRIGENSINALLFGIPDEPAGVNYQYRRLRFVRLKVAAEAVGLQLAHQPLGIHQVLRATQTDNINVLNCHL